MCVSIESESQLYLVHMHRFECVNPALVLLSVVRSVWMKPLG